jgi:hypothetical protein
LRSPSLEIILCLILDHHLELKCICIFFRFEEVESAVKSCELNGFELEGNVVRVDMATATPAEKDQVSTVNAIFKI